MSKIKLQCGIAGTALILLALLFIISIYFYVMSKNEKTEQAVTMTDKKIVRELSSSYFNYLPDKFTVHKLWDGYIGFFKLKTDNKTILPNSNFKVQFTSSGIHDESVKKDIFNVMGVFDKMAPKWYANDLSKVVNFKFYTFTGKGQHILYDIDNKIFYFKSMSSKQP